MTALREQVRAAISNAFYDARNDGRTMEHAADDAAGKTMALLAAQTATGDSGFWSISEWEEWSNLLADLIPDGDEARFANPEGAQESIIEDCLREYVEARASLVALIEESRGNRTAAYAGASNYVLIADLDSILGNVR